MIPTLTDGVVTLRAHRPDDVEGSMEQSRDPESQRWTTVPVPSVGGRVRGSWRRCTAAGMA